MESKRNCMRWQAEVSRKMMMGAVVVLSLMAAAATASGGGVASGGSGVARPSETCTGCYRGCFSKCMSDKGDELNTIDPFVCSAECFVHCIFSFYDPPLISEHTFCTAGCSVSRCSKFSYSGHPNTGRVGICMDSCSIGCTEKHDQYP